MKSTSGHSDKLVILKEIFFFLNNRVPELSVHHAFSRTRQQRRGVWDLVKKREVEGRNRIFEH